MEKLFLLSRVIGIYMCVCVDWVFFLFSSIAHLGGEGEKRAGDTREISKIFEIFLKWMNMNMNY